MRNVNIVSFVVINSKT